MVQGEHAASHGIGVHLDLSPGISHRQNATASGRNDPNFKSPDASLSFLSNLISSEKQIS
jgi:hypothetical protein